MGIGRVAPQSPPCALTLVVLAAAVASACAFRFDSTAVGEYSGLLGGGDLRPKALATAGSGAGEASKLVKPTRRRTSATKAASNTSKAASSNSSGRKGRRRAPARRRGKDAKSKARKLIKFGKRRTAKRKSRSGAKMGGMSRASGGAMSKARSLPRGRSRSRAKGKSNASRTSARGKPRTRSRPVVWGRSRAKVGLSSRARGRPRSRGRPRAKKESLDLMVDVDDDEFQDAPDTTEAGMDGEQGGADDDQSGAEAKAKPAAIAKLNLIESVSKLKIALDKFTGGLKAKAAAAKAGAAGGAAIQDGDALA